MRPDFRKEHSVRSWLGYDKRYLDYRMSQVENRLQCAFMGCLGHAGRTSVKSTLNCRCPLDEKSLARGVSGPSRTAACRRTLLRRPSAHRVPKRAGRDVCGSGSKVRPGGPRQPPFLSKWRGGARSWAEGGRARLSNRRRKVRLENLGVSAS